MQRRAAQLMGFLVTPRDVVIRGGDVIYYCAYILIERDKEIKRDLRPFSSISHIFINFRHLFLCGVITKIPPLLSQYIYAHFLPNSTPHPHISSESVSENGFGLSPLSFVCSIASSVFLLVKKRAEECRSDENDDNGFNGDSSSVVYLCLVVRGRMTLLVESKKYNNNNNNSNNGNDAEKGNKEEDEDEISVLVCTIIDSVRRVLDNDGNNNSYDSDKEIESTSSSSIIVADSHPAVHCTAFFVDTSIETTMATIKTTKNAK